MEDTVVDAVEEVVVGEDEAVDQDKEIQQQLLTHQPTPSAISMYAAGIAETGRTAGMVDATFTKTRLRMMLIDFCAVQFCT